MNIPYHKLTSRHLFTTAHLLGTLSAMLTYAGTHNLWLAFAVSFLSLTVNILASAVVWQIAEITQKAEEEEEVPMDHSTVVMPEPRHETGDRFAPPHPRFSASGHTVPQMLGAVAIVAGAVLTVPALYFILITVMGAKEPRW